MRKLLAGLVLVSLVLQTPAQATSIGTITLDQAAPVLGSTVTFTTSYPKHGGNVTEGVQVDCNQGGTVAYDLSGQPYFVGGSIVYSTQGAPTDGFTLTWASGSSDCIAYTTLIRRQAHGAVQTSYFARTVFAVGV